MTRADELYEQYKSQKEGKSQKYYKTRADELFSPVLSYVFLPFYCQIHCQKEFLKSALNQGSRAY